MLRVEHLKKEIKKRKILQEISFSIKEKEILGLAGSKNAGKTMLAKILAGLVRPSDGKIFIDEAEVNPKAVAYKKKIGYMPQDFLMYSNLKVEEYMGFYASLYAISQKEAKLKIKFLLEMMGLEERQDQYVELLSKNMRKKLSLARCLLHDPKVLILDEPTAEMELAERYEFFDILNQIADTGKSIILTSPITSELGNVCSSLGIMHEGKMLLSGTVEEIRRQIRVEKPIIIKVLSEEETELAAIVLKRNRLIERISMRDREIRVIFSGKPEEENELLTDLIHQNIKVQSFVREEGNLEYLFLELIKEKQDAF